jgi:hypothetical protein
VNRLHCSNNNQSGPLTLFPPFDTWNVVIISSSSRSSTSSSSGADHDHDHELLQQQQQRLEDGMVGHHSTEVACIEVASNPVGEEGVCKHKGPLSLPLSLSDEGAEDARGFGLVRDLMGLRKTRLKSMSNGG